MVGLSSSDFSNVLSSSPSDRVKLYCHSVTTGLLQGLQEYAHLISSIESLECDSEYYIPVPSRQDSSILYYITVSLIPAGHCPGSVMFLIRKDHTTVLYTGDFRFQRGDILNVRQLFNPAGKLLYTIDSVYLDTTFCVPQATFIPSREDCLDLIQKTISEWFDKGQESRRIVHLYSRSRYGYEYLMVALSKFFHCKIHVTQSQYGRYLYVPSILTVLTTDANSTYIHFCQRSFCTDENPTTSRLMPCLSEQPRNAEVLTLIPSVMFFFTKFGVKPDDLAVCESESIVRVCYSSHSSYEEIVDFLGHLKPGRIYPSVKPNDNLSLQDVRNNLAFLEAVQTTEPVEDDEEPFIKDTIEFGPRLRTRRLFFNEKYCSTETDTEGPPSLKRKHDDHESRSDTQSPKLMTCASIPFPSGYGSTETKCESSDETKCESSDERKCGSSDETKCGSSDETKCESSDERKCGSSDETKCGSSDETESYSYPLDSLDSAECVLQNETTKLETEFDSRRQLPIPISDGIPDCLDILDSLINNN